eukprot:g6661.t1
MVDDEPAQRLTMSLIERCTGGSGMPTGGADERASDLLKVEVLRLDWQRIPSIQNLDFFTHLRELYLQHNRIQVIEELDTLRRLEFLALGSNRIRRLENLRHLSKLQVLDLSENMIEDVDTQELPHALVIVSMAGNPCCREPSFRQRITCALPSLKVLDGEQVEVTAHLAGAEECKGPMEGGTLSLVGDRLSDNRDQAVFYVTVHSGGDSTVVPFRFSAAGDMAEQATRFCADNDLHGDSTRDALIDHMKEATAGPAQSPEREEIGADDTAQERTCSHDPPELDRRLHAILHLQKTRARAMQESMASFEQHKKTLLSTTRKLVERKTVSAHCRSDALEEDINKVLKEARAELQLRRARMSTENRQFATDMREKIERVLADRRRETEAAAEGTGVVVSSLKQK